MPSPEVLERFVAKVETNEHAEAIEQFYAVNASMRENEKPPRRGRDRAQDSQRSGQGDDVSPPQPPAHTRPSLHVGTRVNPP